MLRKKMQTQRARQEAHRIWYPVDICLLICLFTYACCVMFSLEVWYVIASLMRATWRMLLNSICCILLLRKATSKADMLFYCFLPSRYNQCGFGSVRFMSVCRYRFTHGSSQSIVCFAAFCIFRCMPKAHTNQNTMYSCLTLFPTCQVRVSRF